MALRLLHTSDIHVATFDALRDRLAPGMALDHVVRVDLLARARAGGMTPALASEVAALVVPSTLCTCSSIGAAAEAAGALRIDRPAMAKAARTGGKVMLVYCLESTAGPSLELLREEMEKAGNTAGIEPVFVVEAWPRFEAGDKEGFLEAIAESVRQGCAPDVACAVLAQASMAGAAAKLDTLELMVLSTPEAAFRAAIEA